MTTQYVRDILSRLSLSALSRGPAFVAHVATRLAAPLGAPLEAPPASSEPGSLPCSLSGALSGAPPAFSGPACLTDMAPPRFGLIRTFRLLTYLAFKAPPRFLTFAFLVCTFTGSFVRALDSAALPAKLPSKPKGVATATGGGDSTSSAASSATASTRAGAPPASSTNAQQQASSGAPPASPAKANDQPQTADGKPTEAIRFVQLDLEPVKGATLYEIELRSTVTGQTQNFQLSNTHWGARIKPGRYSLRLRVYDSRAVPGEWSEPSEFVAKLDAPTLIGPKPTELVKTTDNDKAGVKFSWTPIGGATSYKVEFKVDSNPEPRVELVKTNQPTIVLPVAHVYQWRVQAVLPSGDEGDWSKESRTFTLYGGPLPLPRIEKPENTWVTNLEWRDVRNARNYSYSLCQQGVDPLESPKAQKAFASRVTKATSGGRQIASSAGVKAAPVTTGVSAVAAPEGGRGKVPCIEIEKSDDYTKTSIPLKLAYSGGKYRLAVQANGPLRESSPVAVLDFDVHFGSRTPAAIETGLLRESIEKPSNKYFIASYLVTNVNYQGRDSEDSRAVNYTNTGGTGRLGFGYIKPNASYGGYGIIDYSGITLSNSSSKVANYGTVEGHFVYRKFIGVNQVRLSSGLFYKELPQFQQTGETSSQFQVSFVRGLGPHAGFEFFHPLSYRLGFQVNARIYDQMFSVFTPNGSPLNPTISYQYGFLGSLRLKQNIMGFMGYAHRLDHANYNSTTGNARNGLFSQAGSTQDIQVIGDYVNLLLEIGY